MQLDQRKQLSVGLEPTQCTHFFSLTGFEERLYVTGVLRRLLRSFPGAHGCHDPNLALSVYRADCPPPKKKSTRKVAQKSLLTRQKRHCGHADSYGDSHTASSAICGSPSLGGWVLVNVIGQRSAGGGTGFLLGSGAEGRVAVAAAVAAASGAGGAGSELGRISVGFRKRARRLGHQGTAARRAPFACACAFKVSEM